ncbi:MAG: NADH-quinone oxidoreductase subunit L, partial [Planctomycetes bacterium]|nr:NADH-quinone oxidoreductase subunit L [Planctomycetota bacterium]
MEISNTLGTLLGIAWLLPLAGFAIEVFGGYWQRSRLSKTAAYLAVGCIATGFLCSTAALVAWGDHTDWAVFESVEHAGEHSGEEHSVHSEDAETTFSGTFYTLATFGDLKLSIDYYIDSLTLVMFVRVTFIS